MRNVPKVVLYIPIVSVIFISACDRKPLKHKESGTVSSVMMKQTTLPKPVVNVYIENSGSMDGYVKGQTDFKNAVYNYLSEIKISGITDTLNLNYINSKIITQNSNIGDFIQKLNPTSFKAKGGGRGTSDISNVIKMILDESTNNSLSVLVSDCLFSPGKGIDADEYLVNQQIGIKTNWATALKSKNLAVTIFQLSSQFQGYYFNREDKPTMIKAQRPYYIWIIGRTEYLEQLRSRVPDSRLKGSGALNTFTAFPESNNINYHILPNSGTFDRDHGSKYVIKNIRKENKGKYIDKFTFGIGVDMSTIKLLLGDNYLLDSKNYILSLNSQDCSDYSIEIKTVKAKNDTHSLKFSTDRNPNGRIVLSLDRKVPDWVYSSTDDNGLNVEKAINKTYGLKYLIEGVHEAYIALNYKYYTTMTITVK
ncbi:MAG: hypothetical protein Q8909_01240 [Bacteroidota bacterium]|nr:hypothetical protein [Bacteroidota bacterium]